MEYNLIPREVPDVEALDAALAEGYLAAHLPDDAAEADFLFFETRRYGAPRYRWGYATRLGACGEHTEAFATLLSLAEDGFSPAYALVADAYETGCGTDADAGKALFWRRMADPNGDAPRAADYADEPTPTVREKWGAFWGSAKEKLLFWQKGKADTENTDADDTAPTAVDADVVTDAQTEPTNPDAPQGTIWERTKATASRWGSAAWAGTKRFFAPYKFDGFHLAARKTNVRREVLAGVTTFFAMAYIIFLLPNYMSTVGMPSGGVMIAACLSTAIGCLLTAFLANVPFVPGPGMGLNAFFVYTLCMGMGYTWQQALVVVLFSGILFLGIVVSPLRAMIIEAIPQQIKSAITVGVGLFISFIGLLNADIVVLFAPSGANGDYSDLGSIFSPATGLALIGLLLTALLLIWRVRGALAIGIVLTTAIGFIPCFGQSKLPEDITLSTHFSEFADMLFAFDFGGTFVAKAGVLGLITAVLTLAIVDMFDSVGTLLGTANTCRVLDDEDGRAGNERALVVDALATCVGAMTGTSTVTTYVESTAGIKAGGRTGLTTLTTGILFLFAVFLAPLAGLVPAVATAPAMIIVGVMMMGSVTKIAWERLDEAIPCFLTIVMMPFAYSISDGIAFGLITWCLFKLARGKAREVKPCTYILAGVFLLGYLAAHFFL